MTRTPPTPGTRPLSRLLLAAAALTLGLASPAAAAVIPTTPAGPTGAGFVDEFGGQIVDEIVSGSLLDAFFGEDCRGYAEFDLSAIPDTSVVLSARLVVWLSNHDNPLDPAAPLDLEVHAVAARASDPPATLHAAIGALGSGTIYVSDTIGRTGPEFCPDSFLKKEYDLGAPGIAGVQAGLAADHVTLGFLSSIATDPFFDHIDYIGYTEQVMTPFCTTVDLPGSRITLLVGVGDPGCAPRNHGFWHRYCLGSGTIDPGRHGKGNGPGPSPQHGDIPGGTLAAADAAMAPFGLRACQALDEGPLSDPRLAALRELATMHLNLAAGLLYPGCEVELHPVDDRPGLIVADALAAMEARIVLGTVEALHEARWIGEHVVNGEALIGR